MNAPTDAAAVREAAASAVRKLLRVVRRPKEHEIADCAWNEAILSACGAIRQLDLPGGEEAIMPPVPTEAMIAAIRGCGPDSSDPDSLTNAYHALRFVILEALTPARVERSGEGGGA